MKETAITVTVTISAQNKYCQHKVTIEPSVAPALQYFCGVSQMEKGTDNRELQMTKFVLTMLASKDYQNPPICTIRQAQKVASCIPVLLKKIKDKDITVSMKIKVGAQTDGSFEMKKNKIVRPTVSAYIRAS